MYISHYSAAWAHQQSCLHPSPLFYWCVYFFLNAPICTASLMPRGVFGLFCSGSAYLYHNQEEGRGRWDCVSGEHNGKPAELRWHQTPLPRCAGRCDASGSITRSPSQLQAQKQMVHHTLNVRLCFISPPPPRASCFGGSPHPWTARMGRSPATRSDTGKDPGGVKQARPLEALSFSSSSAVMGTDSAVSSTITASV